MTNEHEPQPANKNAPPPSPRCLHCRVRAGRVGRNASRGLCNVCYWDPAIREKYPKGKRARRPVSGECRNCGETRRFKSRGLCGTCYDILEVRAAFPAHAGPNKGHGYEGLRKRPGRRLPARPTKALPGTAEKVEVMRLRAAKGEQLFHPKDARKAVDDAPSPLMLELIRGFEAYQMKARDRREYTVLDD